MSFSSVLATYRIFPSGDSLDPALGGDMVHAVEIQVPLLEGRKKRVREVYMPVAPYDDIIRRIEALPFEPVHEHLDLAVTIGPGHATRFVLARVQASVPIRSRHASLPDRPRAS